MEIMNGIAEWICIHGIIHKCKTHIFYGFDLLFIAFEYYIMNAYLFSDFVQNSAFFLILFVYIDNKTNFIDLFWRCTLFHIWNWLKIIQNPINMITN